MDLRDLSPKRQGGLAAQTVRELEAVAADHGQRLTRKFFTENDAEIHRSYPHNRLADLIDVRPEWVKGMDAAIMEGVPLSHDLHYDRMASGWAHAFKKYVDTAGDAAPADWPEGSEVVLIHKIAEAMHTKNSPLPEVVRWLRDWHVGQKSAVLDELQKRLNNTEAYCKSTEAACTRLADSNVQLQKQLKESEMWSEDRRISLEGWKLKAEECLRQAEAADIATKQALNAAAQWEKNCMVKAGELRTTQIKLEQCRLQLKNAIADRDLYLKIWEAQAEMIGKLDPRINDNLPKNPDYRDAYHESYGALLLAWENINKLSIKVKSLEDELESHRYGADGR